MFRRKANTPIFQTLPPAAGTVAPKQVLASLSAEYHAAQESQNERPLDTLLDFPKFNEVGQRIGTVFWTVEDAFEGTQVFGETGSGKTSGSGAALATAFLKKGFGGLVLTAKANDAYEWVDPDGGFLKQAGIDVRDQSKVIILGEPLGPGNKPSKSGKPATIDVTKTFNFLDYEYSKTGDATFNLVQLFLTALESGSQGSSGHEDAYWVDALRQLLSNAIDLVIYATGSLSLQDIYSVIETAPQSREQARSIRWQESSSPCWTMLNTAERSITRERDDAMKNEDAPKVLRANARLRNLQKIAHYWLLEFAGLADRTRSVIVSTFTSKVTGLTRWPLFELLSTGSVGKPPFVDIVEETRKKKIVIVNLPVKRYTEVGRFAQVLIKTVWQRGIERDPRPLEPVFLWADEAQFFATKEDMLFQTTARSSGCATVYLTQNICNYYAMMPGKDPKSATDALLGNLVTKIFHANGDPTTNEWAQRLFGKEFMWLSNKSMQTQGGATLGSSQTAPAPVVEVRDFATLRRGSMRNKKMIDAIIFRSGSKQADQKATVLRTCFKQWGQD